MKRDLEPHPSDGLPLMPGTTHRAAQALLVLGVAFIGIAAAMPASGQDVMGTTGIKGAGSTFAYPIISKWSREYRAALTRGGDFPGANAGLDDPPASSALDYEPVGSLAGTLRVKDAAVDFGASDVPLKSEELAKLGLGQFPLVIGGVVAVVNIDGIGPGQISLTGPLLAEIFRGQVTNWAHPAIKALNPDLKLPDARISVIHRSDGSGTTFNFTNYLSKVSPQWKASVGSDLSVAWPAGTGAKGNDGVAREVRQIRNSIGYVEFAQAMQARLSFALIQNRAGRFIRPDVRSFQAAAASANWGTAADFNLLLTDAPGQEAYPIAATVFVLMHKTASPRRTQAALDFFRWTLQRGGRYATQLGYVPLPESLAKQVETYWATNFKLTV